MATQNSPAVGSKPQHNESTDAEKQANDAAAKEAVENSPVTFFSNMEPKKAPAADGKWPKMVYGENGQSRIVADAKEESALKGTWHDNPSQVKGAAKESAPAADTGTIPVNAPKLGMENLPKDHTYRDRVEAQARSLGVEVKEGETLEYLMWKIRMQASS